GKLTRGCFALGPLDGALREIRAGHPEAEREEAKRLRADPNGGIEHGAGARPPMLADERRQLRPLLGYGGLPVLVDQVVQWGQLVVEALDRHAMPRGLPSRYQPQPQAIGCIALRPPAHRRFVIIGQSASAMATRSSGALSKTSGATLCNATCRRCVPKNASGKMSSAPARSLVIAAKALSIPWGSRASRS